MGRTRSTSSRGSVLALVALITLTSLTTLTGCNHCTSLDERICADLGADCAVWRSDATLRGMIIPATERRRRVRESACDAMSDDAIYATRTLPIVRNYIARLRNPSAPAIAVPMGAPPTSPTNYLWYLLTPIMVVVVFGASAAYRKFVLPGAIAQQQAGADAAAAAQARAMAEWQAQQARQQQPPGGPGPGPTGGPYG